jgi:hypothetical protein
VNSCLSLRLQSIGIKRRTEAAILSQSKLGSMARPFALSVLLIFGSCLVLSRTALADSSSNEIKVKVKVTNDDRVGKNQVIFKGVVTKEHLSTLFQTSFFLYLQEAVVVCANGTLGVKWHDASTACLSCKWSDNEGELRVRRT